MHTTLMPGVKNASQIPCPRCSAPLDPRSLHQATFCTACGSQVPPGYVRSTWGAAPSFAAPSFAARKAAPANRPGAIARMDSGLMIRLGAIGVGIVGAIPALAEWAMHAGLFNPVTYLMMVPALCMFAFACAITLWPVRTQFMDWINGVTA